MPHPVSPLCLHCAVLLCLSFSASSEAYAADSDRPNIVLILADDMGSGDVRTLNPDSQIPTPHLDRLASEGMIFRDAHSPSAVCTPTRYGLLTGRYCWRTRLKRGVINGYAEPLMKSDRVTVAGFLKQHGYHTGAVGKWHLGLGFSKAKQANPGKQKRGNAGQKLDFTQPVSDGPHTHGFDSSLVIPASLDFPPYVYIRDGRLTELPSIEQPGRAFPAFLRKGERSPDLVIENVLDDLAKEAARYINDRRQQAAPFFLYVPLTGPHKPVLPHPRFRDRTKLGPYGDFIVQVDATVGAILKAIDDAGIVKNTIVIYTSDNGSFMRRSDDPNFVDHVTNETVQEYRANHHRANGPYRGTKADIWEAGHRVPFFVRWPQQVAADSVCESTVCLTDVFATLAQIIEKEIPAAAAEDSYSFLPLLTGGKLASPRPPVIHHSSGGMFAIREGKWKLVLGNGSGGRQAPRGAPFQKPYQLFDLSQDRAETHNVIEQFPDIAQRLEAACLVIREQAMSRERKQ